LETGPVGVKIPACEQWLSPYERTIDSQNVGEGK